MPKAKAKAAPALSQGAWMQEWEETERGWGCRPDGVWYYPTEEAAKKDTEAMLKRLRSYEAKQGYGSNNVPDEYSRPDGEPRFVQVSEALAAEILEKGRAYRERRERA
jgi:hypothetical protein